MKPLVFAPPVFSFEAILRNSILLVKVYSHFLGTDFHLTSLGLYIPSARSEPKVSLSRCPDLGRIIAIFVVSPLKLISEDLGQGLAT